MIGRRTINESEIARTINEGWNFFRKQVDEVIHIAGEIIHFLKDNNVEVFIDDAVGHYFAEPSISSANLVDFDFLVSIGGDGTFLQASHIVLHSNTPLIGVNYGFTGFLTSIEEEEVLAFSPRFNSGAVLH